MHGDHARAHGQQCVHIPVRARTHAPRLHRHLQPQLVVQVTQQRRTVLPLLPPLHLRCAGAWILQQGWWCECHMHLQLVPHGNQPLLACSDRLVHFLQLVCVQRAHRREGQVRRLFAPLQSGTQGRGGPQNRHACFRRR
jgi:hypothetical protein